MPKSDNARDINKARDLPHHTWYDKGVGNIHSTHRTHRDAFPVNDFAYGLNNAATTTSRIKRQTRSNNLFRL